MYIWHLTDINFHILANIKKSLIILMQYGFTLELQEVFLKRFQVRNHKTFVGKTLRRKDSFQNKSQKGWRRCWEVRSRCAALKRLQIQGVEEARYLIWDFCQDALSKLFFRTLRQRAETEQQWKSANHTHRNMQLEKKAGRLQSCSCNLSIAPKRRCLKFKLVTCSYSQ